MDAREKLIDSALAAAAFLHKESYVETEALLRQRIAAVESMPPAAAWHDKPTCPGWWMDDDKEALHVTQDRIDADCPFSYGPYYGPIPKKLEEEPEAATVERAEDIDPIAAIQQLQERVGELEQLGSQTQKRTDGLVRRVTTIESRTEAAGKEPAEVEEDGMSNW